MKTKTKHADLAPRFAETEPGCTFPQPFDFGTHEGFIKGAIDWSPLTTNLPRFEWNGSDLFVRLDDDRRAIVSLAEQDNTSGLLVRILDKRKGEIDRKRFAFREWLLERADRHPDRNHAIGGPCLHGGRSQWSWHIAVPTTTRPIVEAVTSYIGQFE